MALNESIVEEAALAWFGELDYAVGYGPYLAPGEHVGTRSQTSGNVAGSRLTHGLTHALLMV